MVVPPHGIHWSSFLPTAAHPLGLPISQRLQACQPIRHLHDYQQLEKSKAQGGGGGGVGVEAAEGRAAEVALCEVESLKGEDPSVCHWPFGYGVSNAGNRGAAHPIIIPVEVLEGLNLSNQGAVQEHGGEMKAGEGKKTQCPDYSLPSCINLIWM
ncbi:unnamed protein product [Pleuronectes platessa]|uniref:Uncharacterized protein n=1 Tax=Pleuronectes platessa TaxID=8262 RepID=A0A9N7YGN9_PLEPL|nr:unnamed protein product [Pleuronectes platessa]